MNKTPMVSVLMGAYNTRQSDLEVAMETILNQTFSDFEFVIINDGSTKQHVEDVILSFKDERIRYYKNETNIHIIASMNKGLKLCNGKYIARMDSDDFCDTTRLEKQVDFMEKHPEIGVLGTYFQRVFTGENRTFMPKLPKDIKLYQRYYRGCIANQTSMIRHSVLKENNIIYDKNCKFAEDHKMWADLSYVTDFAVLPEVLVYVRNHPDGVSLANYSIQCKLSKLINLDNTIRDFSNSSPYLYKILRKYVQNAPLTRQEFVDFKGFLSDVGDYLEQNITPPYNQGVKKHLLMGMNDFRVEL